MILIYNLVIFTLIALITFHAVWAGFILLGIGILMALYQTRDFAWGWKRKGVVYHALSGTAYWTLAALLPWLTISLTAILISFATVAHYRDVYDSPQHRI